MLKQMEKSKFFEDMEKETEAHSLRNNWAVIRQSDLPPRAKATMDVWSFKWKRFPDGAFLKFKDLLCACGCQQG